MPITLNHSNIGVQYNTGSNYIIETVKSDLYLRDTRTDITSNLLAEPIVISQVFTESIQSFVHSGGTEAQTTHTITVGQNTICDILIVGGGGSGDREIGGGGGGGAVLYATNITIPANTYTIKVGKGGENGNGGNSEAFGATCLGGGSTPYVAWGTANNGTAGGSGSGASAGGSTVTGGGVGTSTKGTLLNSGTLYNGNVGGNALPQVTGTWQAGGGGGGGAGTAGLNSTQTLYTTRSSWIAGGRPSSGGNGVQINITGTTYYWGAGGGGAGHYGSHPGDGGLGGGGGGGASSGSIAALAGTGGLNSGGDGLNTGTEKGGNGAPNTGSGGGGGGYGNSGAYNGGNGGSGIVIIKFKSIVGAGILDGITHKRLNFAFNKGIEDNIVAYYKFNDSSSLGLDSNPYNTKYNLTPTIVGGTGGYNTTIAIEGGSFQSTNDGDRLEGDFPLKSIYDSSSSGVSISLWFYKKLATYDNSYNTGLFHFIDPSNTAHSVNITLAHYNNIYKTNFSIEYGVSGEVYSNGFDPELAFDTWYHLVFIITKSGNVKVYMNGTNLNLVAGSVAGTIRTYNSTVYPIPTSSFPNTTKLRIHNAFNFGSFSGNVDEFYVFNKELSQEEVTSLYNKTYSAPPNTYTLNFPVPTIADINNNSNIVLRGAYDISLSTMNSSIIPKSNQYIPKPTTFASDLLSIRYNLLNPVLDPSGAQLTYNTSNTNVYHMGSVGIGTKSPEYHLDVRGSVNAKSYYLNGKQINEQISELGLSEGMIAQVRHLTYTQMEIKNNTGWDAINDNLTTGFVIAITPKSNLSKILVNIIVHIGLAASNYSVWWGIKLYRKIGSGDWTEVTGPNGTETGSAAATAGTPVWISYTMYAGNLDYQYKVTNVTGTYLDSPNTTSTVYYTAYWNNRLGDNPSAINTIYLNRAESHGDAYRPAPSSSWTASEIWYG